METKIEVVGKNDFYGIGERSNEPKLMSQLVVDFLEYARYELNFSPKTVVKYKDSLKCFIRDIGDKPVEQLEIQEFVKLKKLMVDRGIGEARITSIIYSVRSFLSYCRNFLNLNTLNPKQIRPPKRSRREVVYLTKEEIEAFIDVIEINKWHGLRFRALVETLLGTGMRISEALSLNRKDIDWERKEAKIVGKGNKERTVFFSDRSLSWIQKYLESRHDATEAIFATRGGCSRLLIGDIWRFFGRYRKLAKINKKLTPHILRHTVATSLVFNGCPIVHVKEILGHERLDTTCKYYLGVDKAQAKKAHRQYLNFD